MTGDQAALVARLVGRNECGHAAMRWVVGQRLIGHDSGARSREVLAHSRLELATSHTLLECAGHGAAAAVPLDPWASG